MGSFIYKNIKPHISIKIMFDNDRNIKTKFALNTFITINHFLAFTTTEMKTIEISPDT